MNYSKRLLSILLTLCLILGLAPITAMPAKAAGIPSVDSAEKTVFANGEPIKIVAGTTEGYTNILYDIDGLNGIEDAEYLQIGDELPTAAGYDLYRWEIYGGGLNMGAESTNVTMTGGEIDTLYGGSYIEKSEVAIGTTNVNVSGGEIDTLSAGSNIYSKTGILHTDTINLIISGGTFQGTVYASGYTDSSAPTNLTNTANITITGGTFKSDFYAGGYEYEDAPMTAKYIDLTIMGGSFEGAVYGSGDVELDKDEYVCDLTLGGNPYINGLEILVENDDTNGIRTFTANDLTDGAEIELDLPVSIYSGMHIGTGLQAGEESYFTHDVDSDIFELALVGSDLVLSTVSDEPIYYSGDIYANGMPIKIVAGTTENYTNILYDIDGDGTIADDEYMTIDRETPSAAGYHLSRANIYGGGWANDHVSSNIEMTGGVVNKIYGGGANAHVGSSEISIKGGVNFEVFGGGYAEYEGDLATVDSANIDVSGGEIKYVYASGYSEDVEGEIPANTSVTSATITVSGGEIIYDILAEYGVRDSVDTAKLTLDNTVLIGSKFSNGIHINGGLIQNGFDSFALAANFNAVDSHVMLYLPLPYEPAGAIATGAEDGDQDAFDLNNNAFSQTLTYQTGEIHLSKLEVVDILVNDYDDEIYANGTPIKIVAGTTENYTNILYDKNGDGTIADDEYVQVFADVEPAADGYNIGAWDIYGGGWGKDVASSDIEMTGGKVAGLYGGGKDASVNSVSVTMSDGYIENSVYGGNHSKMEGISTHSETVTVTMSGDAYIDDYFYAGGFAEEEYTVSTVGTSTLTMSGDAEINRNYYAGGHAESGSRTEVETSVLNFKGDTIIDDYIYGGAYCEDDRSEGSVGSFTLNMSEYAWVESIYAGGFADSSNSHVHTGTSALNILGGIVDEDVNGVGNDTSSVTVGKVSLAVGGNAIIGYGNSIGSYGIHLNSASYIGGFDSFSIASDFAASAQGNPAIYVVLQDDAVDGTIVSTNAQESDVNFIHALQGTSATMPLSVVYEDGKAVLRNVIIFGGTVTSGGSPVENVNVSLMQGANTVATGVTDVNGAFSIEALGGMYNLVLRDENGENPMTYYVSSTTDISKDYDYTPENGSIELSFGEGTPNIVVDGLDRDHKAYIVGADLLLTIEKIESVSAEIDEYLASESTATDFDYYNFKLEVADGSQITELTSSTEVLMFAVPHDFETKQSPEIYRDTNSFATYSTEISSLPTNSADYVDNTYYLDEDAGMIYIFASEFPTYIIGYTKKAPTPTIPGGGSSSNSGNTVDSEETLTADEFKELAESGEKLTVNGDDEIEAEFDTAALEAILGEAEGKTVEFIAEEADPADVNDAQKIAVGDNLVLDLRVLVDGVEFTDFLAGEVTISLPYTLAEGETAANLKVYYVDAEGNKTLIESNYVDGVLTFKTNHFSLYMVTYEVMSFTDVTEGDWYYDAVLYAVENGLFNGTSDTEFSPNVAMNRAMMWTVLARMSDVDTDGGTEWYTKGMEWAMENEVSDGTDPMGNLTREQLVTMLYRYAAPENVTQQTVLAQFSDSETVSEWAVSAMEWAVASGIITGMDDGKIAPQGEATRAQVATMLMRYLTME